MADMRMLKFPLFDTNQAVFDDAVDISMPPSTGLSFVGMQRGVVTLWVLVDVETMPIQRRFFIAGTGHALPDFKGYLGTVFERVFVWHVFELHA